MESVREVKKVKGVILSAFRQVSEGSLGLSKISRIRGRFFSAKGGTKGAVQNDSFFRQLKNLKLLFLKTTKYIFQNRVVTTTCLPAGRPYNSCITSIEISSDRVVALAQQAIAAILT